MTIKKYEIVIDYIIRSIQTGNLGLNDYLPSVRALARTLDFSTSTVFDAYCKLERQGVVVSKERRGFQIANTADIPELITPISDFQPPFPDIQISHYSRSKSHHNFVQLGAMVPPNIYFPSKDLGQCLARIGRTHSELINNYGMSTSAVNSIIPVENTTAEFMYRVLGITVPSTEICHTFGATEGLSLALKTVTQRGDLVFVESPGFVGAYTMLHNMNLVPVEIDSLPPHGLNLSRMELLLDSGVRPTSIIVTPDFQNPTGSIMPLENRQRLLQICRKYGIAVIEDNVLGALRFDARIPTLKELMPNDVIYVGSYSKIMAPG